MTTYLKIITWGIIYYGWIYIKEVRICGNRSVNRFVPEPVYRRIDRYNRVIIKIISLITSLTTVKIRRP